MSFCYVSFDLVDDAVLLGWIPTNGLVGTHHGFHAVLCWTPCDCELPMPRRAA